ncbi:sorting nexin-13-like isoform X1 [Pomacea canaliculata]|uniref:sorting nexin-13-like isoform X1 n=2 Tax=Pomacea canaliculata TaxID=400727 RepID=UPI000D73CE9E|nr:sorting nexin-13-like isoform X1 [Pomacea canaliculata]
MSVNKPVICLRSSVIWRVMELQGEGGWKWWLLLAIFLFFFSFGQLGLLLSIYAFFFLTGCLVIAFYHGRAVSQTILKKSCRQYRRNASGIKRIRMKMEPTTKIKNFDKRMTGASVIDDALKEVLEYTVRDYIKPWYRQISDHDDFLVDVWQCVQKVVITFASRSKEVDWMPYFTQRLVDDFASHIRLYRRASEKAKSSRNDEQYCQLLEAAFFDLEVEMERNKCRDLVCTSSEHEHQYLQDLSEVLLYLLLPKDDFQSKPFRYIIREVLVNGILLPTIDLLSDPDYLNQYIAWLCYDSSFTRESFLTVIRSSETAEELIAVREKVEENIARWRSRDTGGSEDTVIKQNLNSLIFLRDTCQMRLKRLREGSIDTETLEEPDYLRYQSLYVMALDDILNNNTALQAFLEFISEKGGQQYLFFYLNVEGFRAAAAQQLKELPKEADADLTKLRQAATIIYDQYIADKGISRIRIEPEYTKGVLQKIKSKTFSEDVFDVVQARVYQVLHVQYYEEFLQSAVYVRLLTELGLLNNDHKQQDPDTISLDDDLSARGSGASVGSPEDGGDAVDEGDSESLDSLSSITSAGSSSAGEAYVTAQISQTGIVKEPDKSGKSYAVFAVTVRRKVPYAEEEEIWDVYRRYSDFHDLNMILIEKFPDLQGPTLPGKTVLKNMSKEFLEKRRKALDNYLRALLKQEVWQRVAGLEELIMQFLAPGLWEKHKSEFSRKMDTLVNPIRTASRNAGNAVKNAPDWPNKMSSNSKGCGEEGDSSIPASKVGAGLDTEAADNIPLRIVLLMLDEVFDRRLKNQWLRRRMVSILRQLIKSTFGDMINRKIVDHVDYMTSAEQMAEYVRAFRNSFWPGGVLAEPRPPREEATKLRTQVFCKAKMFGSVPDEMRTVMGTDAIRMGCFLVFNMFQHKTLNKRFLYVFLEGVLETLFPDNKFDELFHKEHSRSERVKLALSRQDPTGPGMRVHRRQVRR